MYFDHFQIWSKFYETEPPLRQHLNICLAQVCQAVAALGTGKGRKVPNLGKFVIDYEVAKRNSPQEVEKRLCAFLGGLAAGSAKKEKNG